MKMLPWNRPLSSIDIENFIGQTAMKSIFRGTFSRDELSKLKPENDHEAGVLNLSNSDEAGTHWTAWFKKLKNAIFYFDSFGDLPPTNRIFEIRLEIRCLLQYRAYTTF